MFRTVGAALRELLRDTRVISSFASAALVVTALIYSTPEPISASNGADNLTGLPGQVGSSIVDGLTGSAAVAPGYPRIKIERIGIDLLLVKGDGKTPPVAAEAFTFPSADHLLTTSSPGGGNTYVYSHDRVHMFAPLHNIQIGDIVEIDYSGGKVLRYRVSEIHQRVDWRNFSFTQPTNDDRVTLQTCNGWLDTDPRFIVIARRIPDPTS